MARRLVDGIAGLLGLLMLVSGLRWLADPAGAADSLGMPLLQGVGMSTQIGDFASFFLTAAGLIFVGLLRRSAPLLMAAGLLLGSAALSRILAWLIHGAAFAAPMIAVEIVTLVVMLIAARQAASPSA